MNKDWITSKEFRKITKISSQHLYALKKSNKVEFKQLFDKTFLYKRPVDINKELLNEVAIYARVSTPKQKTDLENQISILKEYATSKGYIIKYVFSDIASGMNENRKSLNELIDKVISGDIKFIVISHKDRLTRFGYDYLENLFAKFGCSIIQVDLTEERSFQEELTQDLIAIIHHFSMKFYGKRKNILKNVENNLEKDLNYENEKKGKDI